VGVIARARMVTRRCNGLSEAAGGVAKTPTALELSVRSLRLVASRHKEITCFSQGFRVLLLVRRFSHSGEVIVQQA